jgi:enoyl-CoA hydratase
MELSTLTVTTDPRPVLGDDGSTAAVLVVRVTNPAGDLLDAAVLADLHTLGRALRADRTVRAVVLTGPRPGVFIPHYELGEIAAGSEQLSQEVSYPVARTLLAAVEAVAAVPGAGPLLDRSPAAGVRQLLRAHAALARLGRLPQVVVAAIDGDALGGGCEVALACDVRVMSRGAYAIGLPELTAGIPPGAGGTERLARAVGPARARAMVLTSTVLSPDDALAAGLVDEVTDPADTLDRALAVAHRVATRSPAAVAAAKRAMSGGAALRAGLRTEAAAFMAVASAAPARERLQAFVAASTPRGARTPWRDRGWID